ncbi:hypothetical protein QYE76_023814 [Lolium multiflorum]|uniref:CCHC-type domain-containing protein n=1 Tax=Lolium multiflorum TaxID=4521 RepID=A0AAD8RDN9_LOLMU|nr:hypothetical protein QYE76_023814 [Lolium multiflorum]
MGVAPEATVKNLYEEETSIARGGEEQLDVKMDVKLDKELDMKISHGCAREEREECARGRRSPADIITWREYEALRNEMRREFRTKDDELKGTVDEIKQTLDATNVTVTGLADQMTDIQRNIADMRLAIENLTAQQQQQDDDEDPELEDDAHNARGAPRGHRPRGWAPLGRNGRGQDEEDGLGKPKFSIPKFEGGADVEEYLTWELKIEKLWSLHPNYSEDKKIKLASSEFDGYALRWWDSLVRNRDEDGAQPIRTWRAMKEVMTSRFVPTNYMRNIFDKLTLLRQGVKTVDEYYMEMEMLMQRGRVRESLEMTMQRFLNGLKYDVKGIVRHYTYTNMNQLLHHAREAESQLAEEAKVKGRATGARNRDMLCHTCGGKGHFKRDCPNRKVMIINEDNEYETGDDVDPNAPDDDDYDTDGEDAYPSDARTIVVSQRALNVLPSASTQRCNLFQTKALVGPDKACKVIIDGGSCRNLASKELCTKLKLKYLPHPHPYYIQWLSDNGEMKEFGDVFPEEVPAGLPPLRGIEHQIDLIPGASLPNRAPYRTNPEETKEIQKQESHAGGLMGHFGREKTLLMLADHFYWPKMRRDVDRYVRRCITCNKSKSKLKPHVYELLLEDALEKNHPNIVSLPPLPEGGEVDERAVINDDNQDAPGADSEPAGSRKSAGSSEKEAESEDTTSAHSPPPAVSPKNKRKRTDVEDSGTSKAEEAAPSRRKAAFDPYLDALVSSDDEEEMPALDATARTSTSHTLVVSEVHVEGEESSPPQQNTDAPTPPASPLVPSPKRARVESITQPTLQLGGSSTPLLDDPLIKEFIRFGAQFVGYRDYASKAEEKLAEVNERANTLAQKLEQSEEARKKAELDAIQARAEADKAKADAAGVEDLKKKLHDAETSLSEHIAAQSAREEAIIKRLRSQNRRFVNKTSQEFELEDPDNDPLLDALSFLEFHGTEAREGIDQAKAGLSRLFPYFFPKKEEPATFLALAKCFNPPEDLGLKCARKI